MAARSGADIRGVDPAADLGLAAALLELQRAGYAVEAELIGDDRIPSLHEDVDALRGAGLYWLATFDGAEPVAAVGWTESHGIVDIDRLVVAPRAHRRGLGSALVRAVVQDRNGRPVLVSTGRDNAPARRLYEGLGFAHAGDREVVAGLWVSDYRLG